MTRELLRAKIHRIRVTQRDVEYDAQQDEALDRAQSSQDRQLGQNI